MEARPLKLLNESELALLGSRIDNAVTSWAHDWFSETFCQVSISVSAASGRNISAESSTVVWRKVALSAEHWIGLFISPAALQSMDAGFGGNVEPIPNNHALMRDLRDKVVDDLLEKVCNGVGTAFTERPVDYSPPSVEVWRFGSGAVVADVGLPDASLGLVLSAGLVNRALAGLMAPSTTAADLVRRHDVLTSQHAEVEVWAGAAELELAMVQSIAVGDVVKLDARVDQPLRVCLKDNVAQELCAGFLGVHKGYKALQLTIRR